MKVLVGTASWSDKSLLASKKFYPREASSPEARLRFYATKFPLVEVDTSYFLGNSPGAAKVTGICSDGTEVELLPHTDLLPDTRHRFLVGPGPAVETVRLDIYPDGGLARLRVWGELA